MKRTRKTPTRSCVACRALRDKRDLLRVVRTPDGEVVFDETGRLNGRGAYICPTADCIAEALSEGRHVAAALKTNVTAATADALKNELEAACPAHTSEVVS